jgi:hypothetical protein
LGKGAKNNIRPHSYSPSSVDRPFAQPFSSGLLCAASVDFLSVRRACSACRNNNFV